MWLYVTFTLAVAALAAAGYLVTQFGIAVADRTGLDDTAVGGLLVATVTSLPELVTTVTAVRRGALTLAVGGIIGGNAFDTLFLAASDIAYRSGSIFHRFNQQDLFVVALTILMTAVHHLVHAAVSGHQVGPPLHEPHAQGGTPGLAHQEQLPLTETLQ